MDAPQRVDQVPPAPTQGFGRARSPDVCPHLRSREGPWRVQHASRDHRCALLARDALLDTGHQRRYCLTTQHQVCPINVPPAEPATRRLVATSPVLVENRVVTATPPVLRQAARDTRRAAGALVAVLLVVAAVALFLVARGPLGGAAGPSASPVPTAIQGSFAPTPAATRRPTAAPRTPAPTEAPSSSPVASPSAGPSRTPTPTEKPARTYTVKRGDTLYLIARKFNVTVDDLRRVNRMGSSSTIRVGQVLRLP